MSDARTCDGPGCGKVSVEPHVGWWQLEAATLAGTVCLGKTHMTELAFSGLGLNPSTATPPTTRRLADGSTEGEDVTGRHA